MTTISTMALYSTLMTFASSCEMHPIIDRYHDYIQTITPAGGIPLYDHNHLPPTLYIPGGHLFLNAKGIIFKVHRYFLDRDSEWLRAIDKERRLNDDPYPSGLSPLDALPLPGISAKQFASMLWVTYNPNFGTHSTTIDEWNHILVAATLLECERIADLANFKLRVLQNRERIHSEVEDDFAT